MKKINIACVIDDDPVYTFAVKKLIKHAEFAEKTLFFPNGKLALDFFNEYAYEADFLPDVILLDINMPVLDGWQFMDEFVKLKPTIPKKITVYIVSSSIDDADRLRAARMELISDFIVKPITIEQLREITERVFS